MNLKKYDNKRVRFIDYENNIIEGISEYYTKEMADAIYGIDSECLKITCFLFRKEEINNITIIDEFTNPYSRLEEMAVEDGMDLVDELLYSEEDEHVYRLLLCIEDKLDSINYQKELYTKLISFARYNENKKIAKELEKIIDLIKC